MHIDPEFLWLAPYIEQIRETLNIDELSGIRLLTTPEKKKQTTSAKFLIDVDNKYYIELTTTYQKFQKNKLSIESLAPLSKIDILSFFAHELAHYFLVIAHDEWDHTPEHKVLESQITILFMDLLTKQGYISDEQEKPKKKSKKKRTSSIRSTIA